MSRLTVKEAATCLGVSKSMLDHYRTTGQGPRFIKLGRKVLYDSHDIDLWIEQHKQTSTAPRLLGRRRRRRMDNVLDMNRQAR